MRVAKKSKKRDTRPPQSRISSHFIMSVIMPCVMLGCKDTFQIEDQETLDKLASRIQRYVDYLAEGIVTVAELEELMKIRDLSKQEDEICSKIKIKLNGF